MTTLFAVVRSRVPTWDMAKPMRSQQQWPEHAGFMDKLAADGFVVLGGPLGDSGEVLLAIKARDEPEIRSILQQDPWSRSRILDVKSVQTWTILLACQNPGLFPPS